MTALARILAVLVAALGFGGSPAKPHALQGVRSIGIRSATGVTAYVKRPAEVRQIVKWFDALPPFVARPCPLLTAYPPDVTFSFRGSSGALLLRAVDHAPGTCGGSVTSSADGATRADNGFAAKVSALLGVDFDTSATTVAGERAAERDTQRLLRLLVLPRGSTPLTQRSHNRDNGFSTYERYRTWNVHLPLDSVVAFENAHLPRGSRRPAPSNWETRQYLAFHFPGRLGLSDRAIDINMTPLKDGWTQIEADANATWRITRPSFESVPAGVRTIEIEKGRVDTHDLSTRWRLVHRVTSPGAVAKIVGWFDALPLSSMPMCTGLLIRPGVRQSAERLIFLDGSGQELARVDASPYGASGACTWIFFSVGGHDYPPLAPKNFLPRVERLLR